MSKCEAMAWATSSHLVVFPNVQGSRQFQLNAIEKILLPILEVNIIRKVW